MVLTGTMCRVGWRTLTTSTPTVSRSPWSCPAASSRQRRSSRTSGSKTGELLSLLFCCKYPPEDKLQDLWEQNRWAIVAIVAVVAVCCRCCRRQLSTHLRRSSRTSGSKKGGLLLLLLLSLLLLSLLSIDDYSWVGMYIIFTR